MEPSIVIIGIVIAVILLALVLRKRDGTSQYSSPTRTRPSASRPVREESDKQADATGKESEAPRGWGSTEDEAKSATEQDKRRRQQERVQPGDAPPAPRTGGGTPTGPVAASGGDYPPKKAAEQSDLDDLIRTYPVAAQPVRPINPPPLPPLQPQQPAPPVEAKPPAQWQMAEPPPPIPQPASDESEELEIPPYLRKPQPAEAALDDNLFGLLEAADGDAEPANAPAAPVIRDRDTREFEAAPPEPAESALDDDLFGSPEKAPRDADPSPNPAAPVILEREVVDDLRQEAAPPTPEPAPAPKSEVNFTAFYPRIAQATQRYGLYIYAHLPTALTTIQTDAQKFTSELGGNVPAPRTTKQPTQIAAGQPITITPECDGLSFDPPTLTKRWDAPYVRYEFDFKATADQIGDELQGRALIAVAGIEVAQLKFTIEVIALEASTPSTADPNAIVGEPAQPPSFNRVMGNSLVPPPNPLAAAKQLSQTEPTKMYTKIFVSYSRKDKPVAESYRLAQLALGNDVFMDTYSIRTGEDWRVALARAIDSADVFQLFWSENAANSENVRDEWDYALHYRCPDSRCADFIRPVFWKPPSPVPTPPAELSHLNFRFVPLADD